MIGIVGGLGPYAGLNLLKKVFDNTAARSDQEYGDVALLSLSSRVEDRTEYLVGKVSTNPAYAISEVILMLETVGATVVGIPCNTAHADEIFSVILEKLKEKGSGVKVLSMIEETAQYIRSAHPDISKVGVLSTTGTYKSRIYADALESQGIEPVVPTTDMQEELIHPAIYHRTYGVKTVSEPIHPQARQNLMTGVKYLKEQGAEAVILGCTEIPLVITEDSIEEMVTIDPTYILARSLILHTNPEKLLD